MDKLELVRGWVFRRGGDWVFRGLFRVVCGSIGIFGLRGRSFYLLGVGIFVGFGFFRGLIFRLRVLSLYGFGDFMVG